MLSYSNTVSVKYFYKVTFHDVHSHLVVRWIYVAHTFFLFSLNIQILCSYQLSRLPFFIWHKLKE